MSGPTRTAQITPPWPWRMPMAGMDGVMRRRGEIRQRLLHVEERPVVASIGQARDGRVVVSASAQRAQDADEAIERMRRAYGVDLDLREFHHEFSGDPLIGPSVRRRPWLRPRGRPVAFEALAWAVTEQLIEYARAAEIQRRIVWRLGRRCERTGLRDLPSARTLADEAPARLQSLGLSAGRALALRKAAGEVAAGRADLDGPDHERAWARLRAIPGIGSWTVECLALMGQGRLDQLPAGDLAFVKLVGRLRSGGDPRARATEEEVREFFAPYGAWKGLAALHALGAGTT